MGPIKTYRKREGTTNQGKAYEDLILADLALQFVLNNNIKDFKLSSNVDGFGKFDDVVAEVEMDNATTKYAIQIKHKKNQERLLLAQNLTNEKGFSIPEYFDSFLKLSNREDFKFILMTNRKFTEENATIFVDKMSVVIKREEIKFFSGSCHRFIIDSLNGLDEKNLKKYQCFFGRFLLLTDQPNVEETEKKIVIKFRETFLCEKKEAERFLKFIGNWNLLEKKKDELDKNFVCKIIACCVLEDCIQPFSFKKVSGEEINVLREAVDNFHITVFKEESYDILKGIWGDRKEMDEKEASKIMRQFQLGCNKQNKIDDLDPSQVSQLLWLMQKCPLIVKESATTKKLMKLCQHQKFILLQKSDEEHLSDCNIFRNLSDLMSKPQSYERVIKTLKLSIQGKEKITLESLLHNDEFNKIITTNDLVNMLSGYRIGEEQERIIEPYVERFVVKNHINIKYMKTIEKDTLIVVDTMDKLQSIVNHIGNFNQIEVLRFLKEENNRQKADSHVFYHSSPDLRKFVSGADLYVERTSSSEDFTKLCQQNVSMKRIHHLRIIDQDKLEWIRSKGDIDDLEKYRSENEFMDETELHKSSPDNNINIVIGDAGMGKSELLKKMKNNTFSQQWSLLMQPKDIAQLCKRLEIKQDRETELVDFLITQRYPNYPEFDKNLLKLLIKQGEVVFFWDAIDELTTTNADVILDLIQELSSKSVCQWITVRSHLKKKLEKKFNVLSRDIRQFNKEEQAFYIKRRLQGIFSDEEVSEIVPNITSELTLLEHTDILGIPLQIFMITELFRRNPQKYFNLFKRNEKTIFTLADLYNNIIEEKFHRFYEEKADIKRPNSAMKDILRIHKKDMYRKYQESALKSLVPNGNFEDINCDDFLKELQTRRDCLGLILEVYNNYPLFVHNSYTEFFVAMYLTQNQDKIKHFGDVLFDARNNNVRFFFDLLTAEDSMVHVAALYKNVELLKRSKSDVCKRLDKGGRSVLQLACSWGQRFPVLSVTRQENIFVINNENDKLFTDESYEYAEMLQYLLNECGVSECDKREILAFAEKAECLLAKLKVLLEENEKSLSCDDEGLSILYYSAKFGYDDVFKLFEKVPFVKTKKEGFSLLHLAVVSEQERFLGKLLDLEVYRESISDKDNYGETALFKACQNGYYNMSLELMSAGAQINIGKNDGSSPLHTACLHHHFDIVRLLLDRGCDINIAKNFGVTPLHVACWNGHFQVVKHLVSKGADLDVVTDDGYTPLFVASRNDNPDSAIVLLKAGADVNLAQKDGATPLFIASQEGHLDCVELLLEFKADVNLCVKSGESPLYMACQNGHVDVVKTLIKHCGGVDAAANNGWTSLHIAAQQEHFDIVKILIRAGADVNVVNFCGKTPLDVAQMHGYNRIVEVMTNTELH